VSAAWHSERAVNFPTGWVVRRADDSLVAVVGVFGAATESEADLAAAAPELLELIRVSIGNVRSLGPAGALAQVHTPYQEWLAQLEAVYTKATGEAA
jgi:hypothetical protein